MKWLHRMAWAGLIASGAGAATAARVSAQDCAELDCGPGSICRVEQGQLCGTTMPPCAPGGGGCAAPEDEPPTCEPFEYAYCTNAPCATNADCPSDMVCHAWPTTVCSAQPSAGTGGTGVGGSAGSCADEKCEMGGGFECHEEPGEAVCIPRHEAPCGVDADCGPGFSCEQDIIVSCSGGSAGTAGSAGAVSTGGVGGGALPPDMGTCSEETLDTAHCELQHLPCEADSDCPGTLSCVENWGWSCDGSAGAGGAIAMGGVGGGEVTGGTGGPAPGGTGAEEPDADGGVEPGDPSCGMQLISKVCSPYGGSMTPGSGGAGGQTGGSAGSSSAGGSGAPTAPGMSGGGAGGNAGSGGTAGGPASGPGESDNDDGWFPRPRLGCAVAGADAKEALWSSLALLGLVGLALRRRARTF